MTEPSKSDEGVRANIRDVADPDPAQQLVAAAKFWMAFFADDDETLHAFLNDLSDSDRQQMREKVEEIRLYLCQHNVIQVQKGDDFGVCLYCGMEVKND